MQTILADLTIWSKDIQYGFAALCFVLVGVLVWMIRQLLRVMREHTDVIKGNTAALNTVATGGEETRITLHKIHEELLKRPCLFNEETIRLKGEVKRLKSEVDRLHVELAQRENGGK